MVGLFQYTCVCDAQKVYVKFHKNRTLHKKQSCENICRDVQCEYKSNLVCVSVVQVTSDVYSFYAGECKELMMLPIPNTVDSGMYFLFAFDEQIVNTFDRICITAALGKKKKACLYVTLAILQGVR